jgi:hypothetical protein
MAMPTASPPLPTITHRTTLRFRWRRFFFRFLRFREPNAASGAVTSLIGAAIGEHSHLTIRISRYGCYHRYSLRRAGRRPRRRHPPAVLALCHRPGPASSPAARSPSWCSTTSGRHQPKHAEEGAHPRERRMPPLIRSSQSAASWAATHPVHELAHVDAVLSGPCRRLLAVNRVGQVTLGRVGHV